MAYFAAILHMENEQLNATYRPDHLNYLKQLEEEGKVFAKGPFVDGAGGMVIYKASSFEEAKELAEKDPYVIQGVRTLELHEWGM
ncbi:YciI family protein [Halalkalibacter krulwichiae]|uniref:YciI-like protein n=1 Tax=Halalkalibacter krulwichiae TaxID=199441 RepID=A0A1X9MEZ5_9BACI|nr:YciI family protein [Halalkalibacter krulwichiae]ARK30693.1 YciI-like protein [Halalkalibacter krulwichiae]